MRHTVKILSLMLLLGTTAAQLAGCGNDDVYVYRDGYYYITIVNDSPWAIYVEPFGIFLGPRDTADIDVYYDYVHVVVFREYDGLVLADLDMAGGDVLVVD
jgi:hypothetical protein